MIDEEVWLMMKSMKIHGTSISDIARQMGRDRKTVRKYILADGKPPKYKKRPKKPSILDPYKEYIDGRIEEHNVNGVKLFEEIQERGYRGKYTIVKEYARTKRKERAIKAVYRYETKPGVQTQVDWKDLGTVEMDGGAQRLYAFSMVLSNSRAKFLKCTLDTTTETFIRCHLDGFEYFGGYTEEFLYDNTKNVVLERALLSSDSKFNPLFKDFSEHFGFIPRLCKPYRPQTKGKIENVIKYAEGNFFNGLTSPSIQNLNMQLLAWCRKVDSKPHGTTGISPLDLLERERKHLLLVQDRPPYQIVQKFTRDISRDCYISFMSNKYSVPWKHAGRQATLLVHNGKMKVKVLGEIVCEHEIRTGHGHRVRVKEHFVGLYKEIRARNQIIHERGPQKQTRLPIAPAVVVEQRSLDVYDQFCNTGGE
jgi:transposase